MISFTNESLKDDTTQNYGSADKVSENDAGRYRKEYELVRCNKGHIR